MPLPSSVLVAGATGALGREVVAALVASGVRVRALTRQAALPAPMREMGVEHARGDVTRPASLRGVCDGVDGVFSCAGAPLALGLAAPAAFSSVDGHGNVALFEEARRAGVRDAAYVAVFAGAARDALAGLDYVRAHERVVAWLGASGMRATIVRPTGFFSVFTEIVRMAARGRAMVIGDGSARTNPVHEADVAAAALDGWRRGAAEVNVGGPTVLTREAIARLALDAVGRPPRVARVPAGAFRAVAAAMRPFHPRLAALLAFGTEVSVRDVVAPALGRRELADHCREVAATLR